MKAYTNVIFSMLTVFTSIQALAAPGWECVFHSAGKLEATNYGGDDMKDAPFYLQFYDYTRDGKTKAAAIAALQDICVNAFTDGDIPRDTVRLAGSKIPATGINDQQLNIKNNISVCQAALSKYVACEAVSNISVSCQ